MSAPAIAHSAWNAARTAIDDVQSVLHTLPAVVARIPRIGQLDAELLDEELAAVLEEPLVKSIQSIKSSWRGLFELELGLVIRLILYKLSVWDTGATYGAKLQGLKLVDSRAKGGSPSISRRKLLLHALLTIVIPYVHSKFRGYALSRSWPDAPASDTRRRTWELLTRTEAIHSVLGLAGFMSFLWDGRYRTLLDRLLGLRLVVSRQISRSASYEFMNRQIVWHALTEFLLFLVPLVDMGALRRRLRQWVLSLKKSTWLPATLSALLFGSDTEKTALADRKGPYWALPQEECAICTRRDALADASRALGGVVPSALPSGRSMPKHPLQTPYVTSCSHIYCYVCVTEEMVKAADEGETGWQCLRCAQVVQSAARLKAEESELDDDQSSFDEVDDADDADISVVDADM